MKTMFAAADNAKKRFQKPNILRRRSKQPMKHSITESPSVKKLVTASTEQEPKFTVLTQSLNKNILPGQRMIVENSVSNEVNSLGDLYQIDGNVDMDRSLAVTCDVLTNNNEENVFEATINVDSFINNSEMEKMVSQADVENELARRMKQEWCLDFINDTQEIIIEDIDGSHLGSLRLAATPSSAAAPGVTSSPALTHTPTAPSQNITLEYMNCTMNFKCNIPNCSKRFRSEEALNKHRSMHIKGTKVKAGSKSEKPVVIQCPVKKVFANGIEEPCRVHCSSKKDIINHLNEAHDPMDAMYICADCGRRFYWAAGLRAHSRTHRDAGGGGGGWACSWAGCGRVFRQPCRLREHMRAHTGDKPYPCRYPNCGWSFRTASKLLRHARRHTGERRHECEECGRAFRRREHLRDHTARHHAYRRACSHTGCPRMFNTVEALQTHLEVVHNEDTGKVNLLETTTRNISSIASQKLLPKETFMVNLKSPALSESTLEDVETATLPNDVHTEAEAEMAPQTAAESGILLQAEEGAGLMLQMEAGMMLHTGADAGMMIQAEVRPMLQTGPEAEVMLETEPEAGMMLQTGPEAGMMLQTEPKAGMMLQRGPEAGMMLQAGPEAGIMLQTQSEAGMMLQTEPEAGMMSQRGPEAGIMLQTEPEAGMILQTGPEAGMMLQRGPEAGMMLQTRPEAGIMLQRGPEGVPAGGGAGRAARTHCTWPFPARAEAPQVFEENANQEYILEDDTTEEISERSDSNIYTIRSDLFLHGNVLNNEDSVQMGAGAEGAARGEGRGEGGAHSLLDAHPTSDLMQEELMYSDAAVDESSFRVFLLNGEELT